MNDCRSLWGKLLSSMIRLQMNVTIVIDLFMVLKYHFDGIMSHEYP